MEVHLRARFGMCISRGLAMLPREVHASFLDLCFILVFLTREGDRAGGCDRESTRMTWYGWMLGIQRRGAPLWPLCVAGC